MMFAKTPLYILGVAVVGASQDCRDVQVRLVLPSEAGNTSDHATNRDKPHWVTAQPTTSAGDVLRVFLPGTFGNPAEGKSHLLNTLASCSRPTIGLSYSYIPLADATRNEICYNFHGADSDALGACLALQHSDALWGSEPGKAGLWPSVSEQDSVTGRLTSLLAHLDKTFPEEEWARFREGDAPRWDRILVTGHSQGAGHAGYLAQTTRLAGAALLSGPQDECIGCAAGPDNLWLAQPWATRHVRAARHLNESAGDVIGENWRRMVDTLGWPAEPTDVGASAIVVPPYGAAVTEAPPNPAYTGGRPYHISMVEDSVTPMTTFEGHEVAVYELALWPALFEDSGAADTTTVV